ncbi:MAG: helix-turn-helix domain-containing protein [Deltaproteobacteria bacterium]|nr:helix-turn-helix domain-containing protein [Deltaproteobacteria bacterium]MBI3387857.1 helix-turn-helix domain-containing protein [Deltaproteobacteria bacterium]
MVGMNEVTKEVTKIDLSPATRVDLERVIHSGPSNLVRRVRIILARAEGESLGAIARAVGMHRDSVRRWVVRFHKRGMEGLKHGNAGKPKNVVFDAATRTEIVRRADLDPRALGEPYAMWSLYKLRDHLIRQGIVRTISVESLRLLLRPGAAVRQHWVQRPRGIGAVTPELRRELLATLRHADAPHAQRARALLELADGRTIGEVARNFHIGKNSLRRWVAHFRLGGAIGLAPTRSSAGRASPLRMGTAAGTRAVDVAATDASSFDPQRRDPMRRSG